MNSFFHNFYSNKALVFTSIVFFLVSIFAINLTLNLSDKSTNTTTQAQMTEAQCNQILNEPDCEGETLDCEWDSTTLYRCSSLIIPPIATNPAAWCQAHGQYTKCQINNEAIPPNCTGGLGGANRRYSGKCILRQSPTNSPTPPGGGGTQPPGATATPTPGPTSPPNETPCGCGENSDAGDGTFDNICDWAPNTCIDTIPGGYCDPGAPWADYNDADWARGYYEYAALGCGTGGPNPTDPPGPTNTPPPGTTNTPTPTADIPPPSELPTVSRMIHGCSIDQTKAPSWDMAAENIDTHGLTFQQANFMFCMTPHRYPEQAYVFVKFFEEKGQWESTATQQVTVDGANVNVPIWACWSMGRYESLPAGSTTIEHTVNSDFYLGVQITNPVTNQLHYPRIADLAAFTDNAKAQGKILNYPVYDAKVVLISNHGIPYVDVRINDQIVSREDPERPNGHIKFHSSACSEEGDSPTATPPPPTCSYVTELINPSKYTANEAGYTQDTQELDLSTRNIDYTKAIKIGADWGWTGRGNGQLGLVDLPGTEFDLSAGANEQKNESSKIDISTVTSGAAEPSQIGTINCPDVGEFRASGSDITYFADGRRINYQSAEDSLNIISNLKDVERDGGSWYTCPKTTGSRPLFSSLETERPAGEWNEFTIPDNVVKLRFEKTFTGNTSSKGSHFTQIMVSYCQNIAESTPTPVP